MKIYRKNITLPAGIGWNGAAYKEGYEKGMEDQKEKLISTSVTENGTYTAEDGFSEVVVDVPEREVHLENLVKTFSANGIYDVAVHSGYDGFKSPGRVYVEVPQTGYTQQDLDNAYASGMTAGYESGWTDAIEECQRDWSKEYLTIEALSGGTLNVNQPLDSSLNKGEWVSHESGYTLSLNAGDRVRFRGTILGVLGGYFSGNTLAFKAMGNIGSVDVGDNFENYSTPARTLSMFKNCSGLTDASNLIFPSGVNNSCYHSMFSGCTNLIATPELPATELARACYYHMFEGCEKLTTAPVLPATTLAENCYGGMFAGCTALTTAPKLPATTAVTDCYNSMFKNCTGLKTAPELPATTLANGCYANMFAGCINLTTAPDLPAPVLVESCYYYMFDACVRLAHIKCLATDISAPSCTMGWFEGHRPNGTFVKAAGMEDWTRDESGIPPAWTVLDAS